MPRSSDPAPSHTETPASLREMASHARQLAANMLDEKTIADLIAFAAELEARAAALEPSASVQTISHQEAAAAQRSDPDLDQS